MLFQVNQIKVTHVLVPRTPTIYYETQHCACPPPGGGGLQRGYAVRGAGQLNPRFLFQFQPEPHSLGHDDKPFPGRSAMPKGVLT